MGCLRLEPSVGALISAGDLLSPYPPCPPCLPELVSGAWPGLAWPVSSAFAAQVTFPVTTSSSPEVPEYLL